MVEKGEALKNELNEKMTESQMLKMSKFPESYIKLGDTVEYVKDGTKKNGTIYSVNSNAKTFDIFCKHENIVDKDIQADGVEML